MSPNGRRAWREWVRRQDLRRKYKQPKGSICRMARQARRHIPVVPGVVVSLPLTARSLVGMTQGARKRAADRVAVAALGNDRAHAYTREYGSYLRSGEYLGAYWTVRAEYRIGERLRPCPGCQTCMPGVKGWHIDKVRGRFKMPTIAWSCDGSGVLPARKEKP